MMQCQATSRSVQKTLMVSLALLFAAMASARGEHGDGSVGDPVRGRLESKARRLFGSTGSSFRALFRDSDEPKPENFVRTFAGDEVFTEFKSKLTTFEQYRNERGELVLDPNQQQESGVSKVRYYIVEEDLPLTELELIFYEKQRRLVKELDNVKKSLGAGFSTSLVASAPVAGAQPQLRVMTEDNALIRWVPGSVVTFCVLKWTFNGNEPRYRLVQRNLQLAAQEWERVCNVRLEYRGDYDDAPLGSAGPVDAQGKPLVTFVALQYSLGGAIARAFFPNDPVTDRFLIVDPEAYYTTTVDRIGVLRHELGHVLGFRHEHISPDAPVWTSEFCGEAATDSAAVTRYDRASVMHYPCTSVTDGPIAENFRLEITDFDRRGARGVYGEPGGRPTLTATFKNFDPAP